MKQKAVRATEQPTSPTGQSICTQSPLNDGMIKVMAGVSVNTRLRSTELLSVRNAVGLVISIEHKLPVLDNQAFFLVRRELGDTKPEVACAHHNQLLLPVCRLQAIAFLPSNQCFQLKLSGSRQKELVFILVG